jgi:hypothetical protein
MNERLKELAHDAGLPTYNPSGIPTKLEKFAELIVQECIKVSLESSHRDDDMGAIIARHIKQHFGVEE